jgi:hypothetical protein
VPDLFEKAAVEVEEVEVDEEARAEAEAEAEAESQEDGTVFMKASHCASSKKLH